MRFIAELMDTAFVIPGTKIRFGLDPLIGLLPGVGDAADALISSLLLTRAARYGVPKIILLRMAANVLINTVGGALPVVGDAFSVWFKSNALNYELLRKHAGSPRKSSPADWIFVIGLIAGVVLFIALVGVGIFLLIAEFAKIVRGG